MSTRLPIIFFFTILSFSLFGQFQRCGLDQIVADRKAKDPSFQIAQFAYKYANHNKLRGQAVITVPVVVHVIHAGTAIGVAENVAENLIHAQLDQINDDFRRLNSDRNNTPAAFLGVAADVEIEFCLAKQDTSGYSTTGINRYNFGLPNYTESQLKHIVQSRTTWDRDKYLNIWIADIKGLLGYAYLPGGDPIGDGLIINYITVGSLSQPNPYPSAYRYGRTATHEIAHWLGLDHHWAVQYDCTIDDGVADTPSQYTYYIGCPHHPSNSCSTADMFMNFLDYVDDDCMNLFTEGQKNVMHGVLNNERSGLLTSIGCRSPSPLVMFNTTKNAMYEGTTNCNGGSPKAMAVQVDIAAPPSRTAVVNISSSGTAQIGSDYTLSTSSLTFPAGSIIPKTFYVNVLSDGSMENMENVNLSYTVNANGGNAVKGHKKTAYSLEIINDDLQAIPNKTVSYDIGSDNGSGTLVTPFKGSNSDSRFQMIITADEIKDAGFSPGMITSLNYYVTQKKSTINYSNFSVKMALTNKSEFVTYDAFASSLSQVYSNSLYTVAGKLQLRLDSPFWWDGYSNLIIEVCYDNTSSTSDDAIKFENTYPKIRTLYEHYNNTSGCRINFMSTRSNLRPYINLEMEEGQNVATSTNDLNGYSEHEFGPYETVHFYDSNTGAIMMTIQNLDNHDYGCTKVSIDRSGQGAEYLWDPPYQSVSKSYIVTPEFNKANGRNKITLYYENVEIQGWEQSNYLGSDRGDLLLTKCPDPIGQSTGAGCTRATLTPKSFGGNLSYEAITEDGFSGFTLSNWLNTLAAEKIELSLESKEPKYTLKADILQSGDKEAVYILRKKESEHNFIELDFIENPDDAFTWIDTQSPFSEGVWYKIIQNGQSNIESNLVFVSSNQEKVTVFPSITSDVLQVGYSKELWEARAISSDGRSFNLISTFGRSGVHQMKIDHLPSGMYHLVLRTQDGQVTTRFVKI